MKTEEHEVVVEGQRFALKRWHSGEKRVLALHGWMDNAATWDRVAPQLHGFDVWCLDFAGHGFSDHRPAGSRYHTVDHVLDVYGVIQSLGWSSFSLLGHSMGAAIAMAYAAAFPEKVEKLALVDGMAPYSGDEAEVSAILRTATEEWFTPSRGTRIFPDMETAVQARMKGLGQISESCSRILCSRGVKEVEGGYAWCVDRRVKLASPMRFTESQVLAMLASVQAPVLLLLASQGYWSMQPDKNERRASTVKSLKTVWLKGGHYLHLEEAATQVANEIVSFV